MNVSLSNELERFVHEKVASGFYTSASEVIRDSLRLLKERDLNAHQNRLLALQTDIYKGLTDLREAKVYSQEEVYTHLKDKLSASKTAKR